MVVLAGEQEVDGKWLREMRNSSSVSETCSATDLCERSHLNIVPRYVELRSKIQPLLQEQWSGECTHPRLAFKNMLFSDIVPFDISIPL